MTHISAPSFDDVRHAAEAQGYRLWNRADGYEITWEGMLAKVFRGRDTLPVIDWLAAKASDRNKQHPLTAAQRAEIDAKLAARA